MAIIQRLYLQPNQSLLTVQKSRFENFQVRFQSDILRLRKHVKKWWVPYDDFNRNLDYIRNYREYEFIRLCTLDCVNDFYQTFYFRLCVLWQ